MGHGRTLLILASLLVCATAALARNKPWTEERCNRLIESHAHTVHGVNLRTFHGGPVVLVSGLLSPRTRSVMSLPVVLHGKVQTTTGFTGDAALGMSLQGAKQAAVKKASPRHVVSSFVFRRRRRLPRSMGKANRLFDRIFGDGVRVTGSARRNFKREANGSWYYEVEEWRQGSLKRVLASIDRHEGDPDMIVVALHAELRANSR